MSANISPVAWYGGKSRLSAWIAGLLPRHDTYIEAFGGGASVLFTKAAAPGSRSTTTSTTGS